MEFKDWLTVIISFLTFIVGIITLIFIIRIEIKSKEMKDDVWGAINDLALYLNAEQIMMLRNGSMDKENIKTLIDYWKTEHESKISQKDRKKLSDENKKWQVKYDNTFNIMSQYLDNPKK